MSSRRPPWQPAPALRPHLPLETANPAAPLVTWRIRRPTSTVARDRTVTIVADLVSPTSVERQARRWVRVGESYVRAFAVIGLPRRLQPTTLGQVLRLPGVHSALVNHPLPRAAAQERLQAAAKDMLLSLQQVGEAEAASESLAMQDLRRHLSELVTEQTGHHLFGLYLAVYAPDPQTLEARCRAVQDRCHTSGLTLTACAYQHWEGVLTTAPLGDDQLRYLRETNSPTLARLLPTTPPALPTVGGAPIIYGLRAHQDGSVGEPVLHDRLSVLSPHQAKIAATRGGKTYQQCLELAQRYAAGNCALVVLDPKNQEYKGFIEGTLGGTYLVLGQDDVRLNPLMLPAADPAPVAALRRLGTPVLESRAALLKQLVADEASARRRPLSGQAEAQLEEAVLWCYQQRGITSDPASFHADVPTLGDVQARLEHMASDGDLRAQFGLFTGGALGRMLNGPGTLRLEVPASRHRADVGVLGFDLSPILLSNDATLQRVLPVLLANYCITLGMATGARRPTELIIDEAWVILHSAAGSRLLETVSRTGAALQLALTVITQQVREFLYRPHGEGEVPNAAGAAFLNNCETVLLLRQLRAPRGEAADADDPTLMLAKRFSLRPGEVQWLSQCQRLPDGRGATGLLLCGREPIPLFIPRAPGALHDWIVASAGTGGSSHA